MPIAAPISSRTLAPHYEETLNRVLGRVLENPKLSIPGFVVICRRGASVYGPRAFGFADIERKRPMRPDAMMRMYSMTKVLTSTVALMLYEKGLFKLNDPVGKYLPSFDRDWTVVWEADEADAAPLGELRVHNMALGRSTTVRYAGAPARNLMRIKHLMTETSGIGYDSWSDIDEELGGTIGTRRAFQIANALRSRVHPTLYKSSSILGQDLTLAEFCDAIAEAGVLATEPGRFSYGLGAAVLGRVIEVVHAAHTGTPTKLSDIFQALLFDPLGMRDATFFLEDRDPRADRVPPLHGVRRNADGALAVVRARDSVPQTDPPYSNETDHVAGLRKQESGDTGTLMTVEDYGKFLDFLARGGVTEGDERLLGPVGVGMLTRAWLRGLDLDSGLARYFNCAGTLNATVPTSFQFGWAITRPTLDIEEYQPTEHPAACYWSGYANTSAHFFRDDDAWIVVAPQIMGHGASRSEAVESVLTRPAVAAFLDLWR
ncbi:MAG: serine hydrolase domain-containing protein [Alphaproteobacteria bacterium]